MDNTIDIWQWLIQQAPVVVVMGIAIYYLAKKLTKAEDEKDTLAKDVIRLTAIWEERMDINKEADKEILNVLLQIKAIVQNNSR
ncbi:hypothetical protein [Galbibacter orientalis]|uniref:hypothetical protein n=1 Tax=Galbibacter orientalis TaxID=453852 RepID=UPI0030804190